VIRFWGRWRRRVAHGRGALGERPDNRNDAGARSLRQVTSLAWPIAAGMAGETLLGLVDARLVGGLGPAALGGVGVATTLMYLNYSLVFGFMRGVKVRTAFAVGEGRPADGISCAQAGLIIGAIVGVIVAIIGRDISPLLRLLGIAPELVAPARDFFGAVTWGAPATCMLTALIQHRQGLGDTRSPMIVGLAGNVVNALLGYALIYGHAGLPALGVRGGGLATATTEYLELFTMAWLLARDAREARGARLGLTGALREVKDLGLPTGMQFGLENIAFTTFTVILGGIAATEIAAHHIALTIIRTSFLPGIAIGEAASVLVGQSLGARKLDEADRVFVASLKVGIGFMAACGVVFALFGSRIAASFTADPVVRATASRLLLVAAVFQVLDAVNLVTRGALRGAKDVRVPAIIGIAVVWTCIPSAAFFLGKVAGLGALGGWFGFLGETTLAATFFTLRWKYGSWRRPYEEPPRDNPAETAGSPRPADSTAPRSAPPPDARAA